jgi:hypothetical protein
MFGLFSNNRLEAVRVIEDATHRFVTDSQIATWNAGAGATPSLFDVLTEANNANGIPIIDTSNTLSFLSNTFSIKPINGLSTIAQFSNGGGAILGDVSVSHNGGVFFIQDSSNKAYLNNTANTFKFGINTQAPNVALDVVGDFNLSGKINGARVYAAFLTQSGTNAPVATIIENTIGEPLTWNYENVGSYSLNSASGLLSATKNSMVIENNVGDNLFVFQLQCNDASQIYLYSYNNGSGSNGYLDNTFVKITLYP